MTNFTNDEAVARLQRVLDRTGISKQLERIGVRDGDDVTIGNHTLAWVGSAADELIDEPDVETDLWIDEEEEEE